jgi:hypothetical protein
MAKRSLHSPSPAQVPVTQTTPVPKLTRDEYLSEREHFLKILQAECESFDKAVLQLSAAAIGVSFLILDKLPKKPPIEMLWMKASWIMLVACMSTVLFSLLVSHHRLNTMIENLDRQQRDEPDKEFSHWFGLRPKILNRIAGATLILGFIFLTMFAEANYK